MKTELLEKYEIYSEALRIRMIEEAVAKEYPKGEMRCPVHLSIGQEANAVAIAKLLEPNDKMVSTHRGHAHYLAKGGSLEAFLGELYGKGSGCARGNGGSMHLCDASVGFIGSTSIVGGTIPIGVGNAFADKLKGKKTKTAVCIGDAAIEEGVFHESANFAALHNLNVIFFMENNNFSCFTPRALRQPHRTLGFQTIAEAHGIPFYKITWNSFYETFKHVHYDMENEGPKFIECSAYRFVEHCGPNNDDHLGYRDEMEIKAHKDRDPIKALELELLSRNYITLNQIEKLKTSIELEISGAFEKAKAAAPPHIQELGAYIYA